MADMNQRDAKLVQYLNEAYGKERELETALQAHIAMTTRAPYKKRLQQHLRETKAHAKTLERRIKKLGGGGAKSLETAVGKAMAAAKGPLHAARGSGEQEKMLKNAKTEYFNEHEEIATYLGIETLAEKVGDRETAKLARGIRREEERMAKFLAGQITALANAVAMEEVPREQRAAGGRASSRRPSATAKRSKGATAKRSKGATAKSSATKGASAKRSKAAAGKRASAGKRSSGSRSAARAGRG